MRKVLLARFIHAHARSILRGSLLVSLIASLIFFIFNFPIVGHDSYSHLTNLDQYISMWREGLFLPRWTPNNFGGLGCATFYLYPPLLTMYGAVLHFVLPFLSLNALFNVALLLIAVAAWYLARYYLQLLGFEKRLAGWAAILYAAGPYPFYDAIVRSAFQEYLAFAWIIIILIAIEVAWLRAKNGQFVMILSCVGWAALILTNIPMTALMMLALPGVVFARRQGREWKHLIPFFAGAIFAIAIAAFQLIPIIVLRDQVQITRILSFSDYAPFREFWLIHLFTASAHRVPDFLEAGIFPLMVAVTFVVLKRSQNHKSILLALTLPVLVLHIPFIAGPLSQFLPLVSIIQFPVRAYVLFDLGLAIIIASWLQHKGENIFPVGLATYAACVTVLFAVFVGGIELKMHPYPVEKKILWNIYEYLPTSSPSDTTRVMHFVRDHLNEAEIMPTSALASEDVLISNRTASNESQADVRLSKPATVRFHRFYWPWWHITANNQSVATKADSDGLLTADLPAGNYHLSLYLQKSDAEETGETISLFSLILLAAYTLWILFSRRGRFRPERP
jgi:hypothetical protein